MEKKFPKTKTQIAAETVRNTKKSETEIVSELWKNDKHRAECWRNEIRVLLDEKGLREEDLKRYTGRKGHLISKLPRDRETYIGIGMALKQDLNTINQWIVRYANKRQLYIKEMKDIVWIYLITASLKDKSTTVNYYKKYDACAKEILEEFKKLHVELLSKEEDQKSPDLSTKTTAIMDKFLNESISGFDDLKLFVANNLETFDTAYQHARGYIKNIAENVMFPLMQKYKINREIMNVRSSSIHSRVVPYSYNALFEQRVINSTIRDYLSGDKEVSRIKAAPISRGTNISLCLCFGLSEKQINEYLGILGYEPLKAVSDINEGMLIHKMNMWEESHPLVIKFRQKHFEKKENVELSEEEERKALIQMLNLKKDIREEFNSSEYKEFNFNVFEHDKI